MTSTGQWKEWKEWKEKDAKVSKEKQHARVAKCDVHFPANTQHRLLYTVCSISGSSGLAGVPACVLSHVPQQDWRQDE